MTEAARNSQKVSLVEALRSKGFTVSLGNGDSLRVGPKNKLTLPLQEWIRKARPLIIEELQAEPLNSVAEVVELSRQTLNPADIEYDPHPVSPAPPGCDPLAHKEGSKVGWDKVAFYHHPLECECPACIFPEPKYARPSVMAGRGEERRIEELWSTSEWAYSEDRRRQVCVEWVAYHEHLCEVFRSHANHHARQQERYQRILTEEFEDAEQA